MMKRIIMIMSLYIVFENLLYIYIINHSRGKNIKYHLNFKSGVDSEGRFRSLSLVWDSMLQ